MRVESKRFVRMLAAALILGLALGASPSRLVADEPTRWVCPPCSCGADDVEHAAEGSCPVCAMRLVRKGTAPPDTRPLAAILVFDGVQIIDYTGPYEVFGQAGFRVYTVAERSAAITTAMGMSVNPAHSFETAPQPRVLIVPGGSVNGALASEKTLEWVRRSAAGAEQVLSVCNGAFILAKAGLLDGLRATTFYGLIEELATTFPATQVVRDQRYVDNGKLITSAGLSSGIDAAFHVVSKLRGRGEAQRIALHMEYDWKPDSDFARAAFADLALPPLREVGRGEWTVLSTQGDRERWTTRWAVRTELAPAALLSAVEERLRQAGWRRSGGSQANEWTFADREGRRWLGSAAVEAAQEEGLRVVVSIERHDEHASR